MAPNFLQQCCRRDAPRTFSNLQVKGSGLGFSTQPNKLPTRQQGEQRHFQSVLLQTLPLLRSFSGAHDRMTKIKGQSTETMWDPGSGDFDAGKRWRKSRGMRKAGEKE